MRFLDLILSKGFLFAEGMENKKWMQDLLGGLAIAQLIVIDNVADYFCQQFIKKERTREGKVVASDFPCVMPPFPNMFIEFRIHEPSPLSHTFGEAGLWVRAAKKEDIASTLSAEVRQSFFSENDATMVLLCHAYLRERGWRKGAEMGQFIIPITDDGTAIPGAEDVMTMASRLIGPDLHAAYTGNPLNAMAYYVVYPSLLALSFLHCKNVRVVKEAPPPKLSKAYKKKTGRPLLRYHVLHIDHMKAILEREGGVNEAGLKRALHICRGHFSIYGKDGRGLLFGKHAGRFWVPAHTRGSKEHGLVIKDYDVK